MRKVKVQEVKHRDKGRTSDLTLEEVRACKIFAHLSDEQAQQVLDTLKRFTVIIFHFYQQDKNEILQGPGQEPELFTSEN